MKKGTGYCVACEDEIIGSEDEHHTQSPSCYKWKQLLKSDKTGASFIQNTYTNTHTQLKDSICLNCDVIYSNMGNLNKHHKKHPECLKLNLYKTIYKNLETITETDPRPYYYKISASNTPDIFDTKEYYRYWPESMYNDDLVKSKDIIIEYLKGCSAKNKQQQIPKKQALIAGLDNVIFFDDSANVLKHKDMELGKDRFGNNIFILPINVEIKEIMNVAKMLDIYVFVATSRPDSSRAASEYNLKMFEINYDELIIVEDNQPIFEKINLDYEILLDIGRSAANIYKESPCSVILPYENIKHVSIYSVYNDH